MSLSPGVAGSRPGGGGVSAPRRRPEPPLPARRTATRGRRPEPPLPATKKLASASQATKKLASELDNRKLAVHEGGCYEKHATAAAANEIAAARQAAKEEKKLKAEEAAADARLVEKRGKVAGEKKAKAEMLEQVQGR